MSMMKNAKRTAVILFVIAIGARAWSLSIYDPNDRIYTYLSVWDEKGYYGHLPMLRPYSPQLIRSCLEQVIEKGGELDAGIAREYLNQMNGEEAFLAFEPTEETLVSVGFDASAEGFLNTAAADTFLRPGLELSLTGGISPFIQFAGMTGLWFWDKQEANFIPYRTEGKIYYSSGGGASLTLFGTKYNLPSLWKGGIFFGDDTLWFQAGLIKSSFGPFFDTSSVLGPQAPEAGHFSFTWQGGWITLSSVLLDLTASTGVGTGSVGPSDNGHPYGALYSLYVDPPGFIPTKFLILHSALLEPFPWLSVGLIQSTVFGARVDPLYLLPFGILADSQIYGGDWDNSLMGLFARVHLPLNLVADLSLYVDDLNTNKALQMDFNSGQDKLALHTGIAWTPELPILLRVSAEYLLITPYMYTHTRFGSLGYLNYTNFNRHLGSVLDPNSDQLIVKAQLQPFSWLFAETWFRASRHGNGSDQGSGSVAGDGSIWDDGYAPSGAVTFRGPSTFLTQSILESLLQAGAAAEIALPFGGFTAWLRAEYVFEIVWNKELVAGMNPMNNYLKLTMRTGLR
jgi:hypothetical protein